MEEMSGRVKYLVDVWKSSKLQTGDKGLEEGVSRSGSLQELGTGHEVKHMALFGLHLPLAHLNTQNHC